jgi:hypothetical protein
MVLSLSLAGRIAFLARGLVTGLLNSEVPPSLDASVAAKNGDTAACRVIARGSFAAALLRTAFQTQ